MLSGERMKAMRPSRGGRLMVTPPACKLVARRVDVLDLVCEMAEGAADRVLLRVPVVRELDLRLVVARRRQEHEGEAAFLVLDPPQLAQAEQVAIEVQRLFQVPDTHHRVQVLHAGHASTATGSDETECKPGGEASGDHPKRIEARPLQRDEGGNSDRNSTPLRCAEPLG